MLPDIQISELIKLKRPVRSVEFFPPKEEIGIEHLLNIASELKAIGLDFVSVTYGAGGSTRPRSIAVCKRLREELGFTVMPHLTCVGSNKEELLHIIDGFHKDGFRNIMALRGDPPQGHTTFEPSPDGLKHASDLVAMVHKSHPDISLGVGGYPEKHSKLIRARLLSRRNFSLKMMFTSTLWKSATPWVLISRLFRESCRYCLFNKFADLLPYVEPRFLSGWCISLSLQAIILRRSSR
jgi:5,10-methylenetetrahydrofolate reductase